MPHKHKRKRGGDDADIYELPPTQRARPLAVRSAKAQAQTQAPPESRKGKQKGGEDKDTPRAFRRLMALASGKKFRSGLDNGDDVKNGKGKKTTATATTTTIIESVSEELRIRPGEDMRSFSARVDAALPVSGLTRKTVVKDGKDEQGLKVYKTRKERNMHKLYDQWRAEDAKIKERREEEAEERAEREMDNEAAGIGSAAYIADDETGAGKKKKKKGRGKLDDDDPWAELKKKRAEATVGLHDTAQAPPELNKSRARQLKMKDGATVHVDNVPKASGSLKRREELQVARNEVVEAYRKIREHEQAKLNAKKDT